MKFWLIGLGWLVAAVALGLSGMLRYVRPPGPQLIIFGLTAALIVAYRSGGPFRNWLKTLDLRAIVALHLTRFVGFYFLWLYGRGELPYRFAVPGGWGDIIVATTATILLASWSGFGGRRSVLFIWNLYGLADILFVVATAAAAGRAEPASMAALLRLPLSLLATFLVPLIIGSHLLIFAKLRGLAAPTAITNADRRSPGAGREG
ncbi:MAG: hypothetical protein QOD80_1677 [Verrucomicrobiota bacterium]